MSMLLVHELHDARDRILLLKQRLSEALSDELPAYRPFLEEQIRLLDDALKSANIPKSYRVAVVGRFKVGKSSFVNELLGERVAGVHTSPETAAISVFRYGPETRAEVDLISLEDWEQLREDHREDPKSPEVKRYDQFMNFNDRAARKDKDGKEPDRKSEDLQLLLRDWVIPSGKTDKIPAANWESKAGKNQFLKTIRKFTSSQEPLHYLVNKLTIYAPVPILRDQIELIDTPGLGDTERFRVLLTEELVKDVDAILFLTASGASYDQPDKDFLIRQLRQKQIKHLQLIVTKCDETFENAKRDAKANDDDPPSFQEFARREHERVRAETKSTLDELLQSNQMTDDDAGYYFIEQLDKVPITLISTTYHKDGDVEKGGIESVKERLYHILSLSNRFEQSHRTLRGRLDEVLGRIRKSFSERLSTLEGEFDPAKVRAEIESIRALLSRKMDAFGDSSGEALSLLKTEQEAQFKTLPLHLDVIGSLSKEVLHELEKDDLARHWKARRYRGWGSLNDLQAKIADRIFPKVEAFLNDLRKSLDVFMEAAGRSLTGLQENMERIEADHQLVGLGPLSLAEAQAPLFESLRGKSGSLIEDSRDAIVSNLDDFVTSEVLIRLDQAKDEVGNIKGTGTVQLQSNKVAAFYAHVRTQLNKALREHLENRIAEFGQAIQKNAESVAPRIRSGCEAAIDERIHAIESALQVSTEGQKEQVAKYLKRVLGIFMNFAAEPAATLIDPSFTTADVSVKAASGPIVVSEKSELASGLHPQDYEIADGATGFTFERIFCPYINSATHIRVEDPFIVAPHQVDNFARFCALAVRLGAVKLIELVSGIPRDENTDDADSRLETLRRDLHCRGVILKYSREKTLHDREIAFDNGWVVSIGRGLDIYYKPESWISVAAADFSLRSCRQTRVKVAFRDISANLTK